jgi:hypothetical protein
MDRLTRKEILTSARFLASVVGKAHARQMDESTRKSWMETSTQPIQEARCSILAVDQRCGLGGEARDAVSRTLQAIRLGSGPVDLKPEIGPRLPRTIIGPLS